MGHYVYRNLQATEIIRRLHLADSIHSDTLSSFRLGHFMMKKD